MSLVTERGAHPSYEQVQHFGKRGIEKETSCRAQQKLPSFLDTLSARAGPALHFSWAGLIFLLKDRAENFSLGLDSPYENHGRGLQK